MIALYIRSLLFNLFFSLWTLLCGCTIIIVFFLPRSCATAIARFWSKVSLGGAYYISGISYEIKGREHIQHGAVLIACKHQSTWETIIFHSLFHDPAIILKKSLLYIPFLGLFLKKLQMIPIERKTSRNSSARNMGLMIDKSRVESQKGRPLIIFPEGTRGTPGTETKYFSGVFSLYHHVGLNVIPAGLNSGILWGRRSFIKKPGKIILEFCSPLPSGLNRHQFMHLLKEKIEAASPLEP